MTCLESFSYLTAVLKGMGVPLKKKKIIQEFSNYESVLRYPVVT